MKKHHIFLIKVYCTTYKTHKGYTSCSSPIFSLTLNKVLWNYTQSVNSKYGQMDSADYLHFQIWGEIWGIDIRMVKTRLSS